MPKILRKFDGKTALAIERLRKIDPDYGKLSEEVLKLRAEVETYRSLVAQGKAQDREHDTKTVDCCFFCAFNITSDSVFDAGTCKLSGQTVDVYGMCSEFMKRL